MTVPQVPRGLDIRDLTITPRGSRDPMARLDATIAPGQVLCVMGPSGSGKSSLLAALIGTLAPDFALAGRVVLNGRDVTALPTAARRIGILFQDALLFPHLSVAGNLAFALPRRIARAQRQAMVDQALQQAGLAGFGARDPATLSGGEAARVALMRTLLAGPEALLLDEPFSRLDRALRAQVRQFVLETAQARGLPVVLVTHDPEDAAAAGGRIVPPL